MSEQIPPKFPSVPPETYTQEYYESCCEGYLEFQESLGKTLPRRLQIPLNLANLQPGELVLDLGCGRGEMALHCASNGCLVWGLDYAPQALKLAQKAIEGSAQNEIKLRIGLQRSTATELPFATNSVDMVFMLDVVEHLYPHELSATFTEVWRILRPGGRLVIHTMPNLWYYQYGYPLFRIVQRLRGQNLPSDPRARWKYAHVHVNEQTPARLSKALRSSHFDARVWLFSIHDYQEEPNPLVRWGMTFLTRVYPFRWIFCDDIFALAFKPRRVGAR